MKRKEKKEKKKEEKERKEKGRKRNTIPANLELVRCCSSNVLTSSGRSACSLRIGNCACIFVSFYKKRTKKEKGIFDFFSQDHKNICISDV
jgi:hypothetical protein